MRIPYPVAGGLMLGLALVDSGAASATASAGFVAKCRVNPTMIRTVQPTPRVDGHPDRPVPRIVGGFPPPPYVFTPSAPREAPIFLLDGKVIDESVFSGMDTGTIERIDVMCSDESHRQIGIEPGRELVVITSKGSAAEAAREEANRAP